MQLCFVLTSLLAAVILLFQLFPNRSPSPLQADPAALPSPSIEETHVSPALHPLFKENEKVEARRPELIDKIEELETDGTDRSIEALAKIVAEAGAREEEWARKNALAALVRMGNPKAGREIDRLCDSGPIWVKPTVSILRKYYLANPVETRSNATSDSGNQRTENVNPADSFREDRARGNANASDHASLALTAFSSKDAGKRRVAQEALASTADGRKILEDFVSENKSSPEKEWHVNSALRALVIGSPEEKNSAIFDWIRSHDEKICSRIVAVASKTEGPGVVRVLQEIRDAFPSSHLLHLKAEKYLKDPATTEK